MISTGIARVCADPGLLGSGWQAARFGLVTNHAGVLPDLTPSAVALRAAGVPIVALFGPEHGLHGTAQAGQSGEARGVSEASPAVASERRYGEARGVSEASPAVASERRSGKPATVDADTGLPSFDTYRAGPDALDEMVSTVDAVLCDLPDIGTRCYTYIWTMADIMAAAARVGRGFVVLDRPNPIGGIAVEGPPLDVAFASFVGRAAAPLRHGLTMGELARWLGSGADLTVVPMTGWQRQRYFDELDLPWVLPSVNLPTVDTALAYPGTVLFEGTNVSEGRGTTRPFELIGAPYVDGRWAASLRRAGLPGVLFRDARFEPAFGEHAGVPLRGVQLHIVDRVTFTPVRTALEMLRLLRLEYPAEFDWRTPFVDHLWGSDSLRLAEDPVALLDGVPTDIGWAGGAVLYE